MDTLRPSCIKSWHKTKNLPISIQHMAISWTRKRVAQDNASFITRSTLKLNKLMLANIAPETNSFIISTVCFTLGRHIFPPRRLLVCAGKHTVIVPQIEQQQFNSWT